MAVSRRVVLLRGRAVSPWDLRPWERIDERYAVEVLVPERNLYDLGALELTRIPVQTLSGRLPSGRAGVLATRAVGERYLNLAPKLTGADVVHAAELGYWFTWQAALLRKKLGFRLVVTVWETLPFLDAYRNVRTRRYRREVMRSADHFVAATERARTALLLEGVAEERISVSPPGIGVERFSLARSSDPDAAGGYLVLSIGRLVWEKGHQDVLRALALLRARGRDDVRALVLGTGQDERRLRSHASELGLDGTVEFVGSVPYDSLPEVYRRASCLVLASLPTWSWEEQFGMVLAEALSAHVPVVATTCGAIPEVLAGEGELVAPGDFVGLADALESGPLAGAPGARRAPRPEVVERYSTTAAAGRLTELYDAVCA